MPIPQNQILSAEVHITGVMAAGGSNAPKTDFSFHYRRTTVAVAPNKVNLAAQISANILTPIAAALNASWTSALIRVRWPNDAEDQFSDNTVAQAGAITGDRMASEDAAYLLFRTNLRGRTFRGSKHLGPMSESDSTGGSEDTFNAACLTRLATINTALLTPLTDADGNIWNFAILSRKLSQLKTNPTTVVINDVTSALVNKRIGTLNSRKAKSVY